MPSILVINGPNLNLLGTREPEIYGRETIDDIHQRLSQKANNAGHSLAAYQSNAEHELIDRIHAARDEAIDFIIINPGAYTHTSIAMRDALLGVSIPFIEVHLSNIHTREAFRHHSYFSDIATGVICGLGSHGYDAALDFAFNTL
jgi:3-dehydroquinate dehydratase II